jgi:hypothetical protein
MNKSKIRISGLWEHESKDGMKYFKGSLSPIASCLIMPNSYKEKETDPDYYLYMTQNEKKGAESGAGK